MILDEVPPQGEKSFQLVLQHLHWGTGAGAAAGEQSAGSGEWGTEVGGRGPPQRSPVPGPPRPVPPAASAASRGPPLPALPRARPPSWRCVEACWASAFSACSCCRRPVSAGSGEGAGPASGAAPASLSEAVIASPGRPGRSPRRGEPQAASSAARAGAGTEELVVLGLWSRGVGTE